MNESLLKKYEEQLKSALAALAQEDERGKSSQETVILDQQSVGRLSRMDALQQQAMAKATQQRRFLNKARIEAALQRIEDSEFGYCSECGEEIPIARIDLNPTVLTCVECAMA